MKRNYCAYNGHTYVKEKQKDGEGVTKCYWCKKVKANAKDNRTDIKSKSE
jgi:hypothetical protein